MNKVITVNIGNIVFHIEEEACNMLQKYLHAVSKQFNDTSEKSEIMTDVEMRVAEILQQELKKTKIEVVLPSHVQKAIDVMGKPEDYIEESNNATTGTATSNSRQYNRMFRNPDDRVLGGVCSGIGARLDVDPLWIRLAFVLTVFISGLGLLIYIILWIIMPVASTAAEKLEMRGENVTLDNLQKSVKDEFDEVKKKFNDLKDEATGEDFKANTRKGIGKLGIFIENTFKVFAIILVKFIAVVLILIAFGLLVGITAAAIGINNEAYFIFDLLHKMLFTNKILNHLLFVSIFILILVPSMLMIIAGIRLLAGKIFSGTKPVVISLAAIWLLAIIYSISSAGILKNQFRYQEKTTEFINLAAFEAENIYVEVQNPREKTNKTTVSFLDSKSRLQLYDNKFYSQPEIRSAESEDSSFYMKVEKISRGNSPGQSISLANELSFEYKWQDSILLIKGNQSIDELSMWRAQKIMLTLYTPPGKKVITPYLTGTQKITTHLP